MPRRSENIRRTCIIADASKLINTVARAALKTHRGLHKHRASHRIKNTMCCRSNYAWLLSIVLHRLKSTEKMRYHSNLGQKKTIWIILPGMRRRRQTILSHDKEKSPWWVYCIQTKREYRLLSRVFLFFVLSITVMILLSNTKTTRYMCH